MSDKFAASCGLLLLFYSLHYSLLIDLILSTTVGRRYNSELKKQHISLCWHGNMLFRWPRRSDSMCVMPFFALFSCILTYTSLDMARIIYFGVLPGLGRLCVNYCSACRGFGHEFPGSYLSCLCAARAVSGLLVSHASWHWDTEAK